ncbi:recombinase family protein [Undibacterium sp. BYS50W]|nr:recombinase family protein [Undibacterium rugosum]
MRATIYARFSTDKQRESSIEDQAVICRRLAASEGFTVVSVHGDDGVSGSTPVQQRSGGARLLADALADRFEVLIVESLDRLSRDQVEQERIVRRLEHRGILILGAADGYDSRMGGRKIMRGVRGLINELYIDDLRHKTHRGQAGQVGRGFVAGGKSYGYDIVKSESGSTYVINQQQAGWVRFIFTKYAEGLSVQRIAAELNKQGVASPRDSTWAVSAIYGCAKKGSGILNNELYVGRYVWNRSQWVKDPDSGKRQRIDRPQDEWSITDVPDLRVVDQETWGAVQARLAGNRLRNGGGRGSPSRTLFGGMMRCPYCGGAMVAINTRLYGCNNRKDRGEGVCKGISISREQTDKRLLATIRDELMSPAALIELEEQVQKVLAERKKMEVSGMSSGRARIRELTEEITRLVDAIAAVGMSDAIKTRLVAAEAEQKRVQAQLDQIAEPMVNAGAKEIKARIKRILMDLQATLDNDTQRARKIIADLFGDIKILKEEGGIYAEYDNATEKLLIAVGGVSTNVVAGAGFEPTTFGL